MSTQTMPVEEVKAPEELEPEESPAFSANNTKFRLLPIENIQLSPFNPRKTFDEKALNELAASIKAAGVGQPITVRLVDDHYELIAGERRLRASKIAELTHIPALITLADEPEAREIQALENIHREDLKPREKAQGFKDLLANGRFQGDVSALAAATGYSKPYIYRYLHLTDLIPEGVKLLENDPKFHVEIALEIARLPEAGQERIIQLWKNRSTWNTVSLKELRETIQNEFRLFLSKAAFDTEDPQLYPEAGACPNCPKRTGADTLLFEDIQKQDTCLDAKCFAEKTNRSLDLQLKQKPELVQVNLSHETPKRDGALARASFQILTKVKEDKCPSTQKALVVQDTGGLTELGKIISICADPKCSKHGKKNQESQDKLAGVDTKEKRAKTIAENKRIRLETKIRTEILRQASQSYKTPSIEELKAIALDVFKQANFYQDVRENFLPLLGFSEKEAKECRSGLAADTLVAKYLSVLGVNGIYRFMFVTRNYIYAMGNHQDKEINAIAKTYKVDVPKVRKIFETAAAAKTAAQKKLVAPKPSPTKKNAAKRVSGAKKQAQ